MTLTFTFTLPRGPAGAVVLIAAGADSDGDGQLATGEVSAMSAQGGNVWSRTQNVTAPTNNMLFAVTYTVGPNVRYKLDVTDATGASLASHQATTVFAHETYTGRLT